MLDVEVARSRSVRPLPFAAGSLVAVGFVVLSLVWLWQASSPWDRPAHPLLPVVLAWVGFALGARASGVASPLRIGGYALLGAATAVMVWLSGTGALGTTKLDPSLTSWEVSARRVLATGETSGCSVEPPPTDWGPLGPPDEICVSVFGGGMHQRVQFGWGSRFLVYEGAIRTEPHSRCVRHVQDRWWAEAQAEPNCPAGFEFRGGS